MTAVLTSPDLLFAGNPAVATALSPPPGGAARALHDTAAGARNPHGSFASALAGTQSAQRPALPGAPVQTLPPSTATTTDTIRVTAPVPTPPVPALLQRQDLTGQPAPPGGNTLPLAADGEALATAGPDAILPSGPTDTASAEVSASAIDESPTKPVDAGEQPVILLPATVPEDIAPANSPDNVVALNVRLPGETERSPGTLRGAAAPSVALPAVQERSPAMNLEPGAQSSQQFAQRQAAFEVAVAGNDGATARDTTATFSLSGDTAAPPAQAGAAGIDLRSFSDPPGELRDAQRPLQPMADPQRWSGGLGERLLMMSANGTQTARIKLHPEHLGPLDVHITVEDDTARVWFGAQHAQTREALEAALPRLREMFADQGLELVQTDIGTDQHGRDRDAASADDQAATDSPAQGTGPVAGDPIAGAGPPLMMRLVDTYA